MSYLSFSEIDKKLAAREALYVKNCSSKPTKILVINYPSPEGDVAFNIPRTTIPFNICDYVDPEYLRASRSFRQMMNAGVVEVVETEKAEKTLSDPEFFRAFRLAYEEANNTHKSREGEAQKARSAGSILREEAQRAQSQGMKNIITSMDPTLAKALNFVDASGQKHLPKLAAGTERNPRLVALENRVKGGAVTAEEIMRELKLMLGDLDLGDLQAVAAGTAWPTEAQQWARDRVEFQTKSA